MNIFSIVILWIIVAAVGFKLAYIGRSKDALEDIETCHQHYVNKFYTKEEQVYMCLVDKYEKRKL